MFSNRASKKTPSYTTAEFTTATQEPSVVHSSVGRLRVHLPHWSGTGDEDIAAGVRRLRGVTSAAANPLTGNVLILFQPRQTSAAILLEALPTLRLDLPLKLALFDDDGAAESVLPEDIGPSAPSGQALETRRSGQIVYMTGTGRVLYQALGWCSVGLAVVGAIMPGIPTTPFVIAAGYFFIRSSPESHEWLRQSRWFGPLLRDWEDHGGVRRSVKNVALALIGGSMVVTALMGLPLALTIAIITCQVIGILFVLLVRVIEPAVQGPAGGVPALANNS